MMVRSGNWKLVHPSGFGQNDFEGPPDFELYDLEADPYEQNDLAAERPELVDSLRVVYDRWFDDVSTTRPGNYGKPRYVLGTDHQTRTVLTRQDWYPTVREGWGAFASQGYWSLSVANTDTFDVRVRYPDGFEGGTVRLQVDDVRFGSDERAVLAECPSAVACDDATHTSVVSGRETGHTFEGVILPKGPLRLSATLEEEGDRTGGAWHLVVERR